MKKIKENSVEIQIFFCRMWRHFGETKIREKEFKNNLCLENIVIFKLNIALLTFNCA